MTELEMPDNPDDNIADQGEGGDYQESACDDESGQGLTEDNQENPVPGADGQDQLNEPVDENADGEVVSDRAGQEITTESVVEAVLFAADEPISANKLSDIIGAGGAKDIKDHIDQLNDKYEKMNCTFRIEPIAGGFQMLTQSQYSPWLRKLIQVRSETKLSGAALETLAIVAYKQPVMRVEIENVRGVGAGEMLRQLIDKGLVKIVGRAEELGRPLLYGTTKKFLEIFGLANLKDLPAVLDDKKTL